MEEVSGSVQGEFNEPMFLLLRFAGRLPDTD